MLQKEMFMAHNRMQQRPQTAPTFLMAFHLRNNHISLNNKITTNTHVETIRDIQTERCDEDLAKKLQNDCTNTKILGVPYASPNCFPPSVTTSAAAPPEQKGASIMPRS